jgi:hypothetical protein
MDKDDASIGIGAMIVFIALILVAAISSTIIIQAIEELSQDMEDTSSERDYSKIEVLSAYVFLHEPCWQATFTEVSQCSSSNPERGHHEMEMHFILSGDVSIPANSVSYHISCTETLSSVPMRKATLGQPSGTWNSATSAAKGYTGAPFNQGSVVIPGQSTDTGAEAIETLEVGTTYAVMLDLYNNKNSATTDDDDGCSIPVDFRMNLMITIDGGMDSYYIVKCDNTHIATECL